jgi:hypothetical protein
MLVLWVMCGQPKTPSQSGGNGGVVVVGAQRRMCLDSSFKLGLAVQTRGTGDWSGLPAALGRVVNAVQLSDDGGNCQYFF